MKERLYRVCEVCFFVVLAGILYGVFVKATNVGIPCMFHLITGLKCPGCGVTRMAVALLGLDVAGAFEANPAVLVLSPVFLAVFIKHIVGYVKTGEWTIGAVQNAVMWLGVAVLTVYGILRNILPIS
ncbi:MAG: DUF2752 domain-containing protein [Hungatella sp.]|nr:DUF2752 domain-containing protein [Hungatella sp.]